MCLRFVLATLALFSATLALAQNTQLPRGAFTEPDSALLFGSDYSGSFQIVTPISTIDLPDPLLGSHFGYFTFPALSPSGDRVAWFIPPHGEGSSRDHDQLAVYSIQSGAWKAYGNFCPLTGGSVAFSPDDATLAFVAKSIQPSNGTGCSGKSALFTLNLAIGALTTIPYSTNLIRANGRLTWSPDGKYLAAQVDSANPASEKPQHIVVIDISSGAGRTIAEGINPVWSPNGDWIAYLNMPMGQKCFLIHPDGTGVKDIYNSYGRIFSYWFPDSVEWSPDGSKLLINEWYGEGGKSRVISLDIATGKATTMSHNGAWVFGWSPQILQLK